MGTSPSQGHVEEDKEHLAHQGLFPRISVPLGVSRAQFSLTLFPGNGPAPSPAKYLASIPKMYKTILLAAVFAAAAAVAAVAADQRIPGADDVLGSGYDAVTRKGGLPLFDFTYSGNSFSPFVRGRRGGGGGGAAAREFADGQLTRARRAYKLGDARLLRAPTHTAGLATLWATI